MSHAIQGKAKIRFTVQVALRKSAWNLRLAIRDFFGTVTSPFDKLLKIDVPIYVAVNVLHSRVIENVDLGGTLHYLDRMSFR
jgi:hypothetical protein